jgi:hypothetical protein
MKEFEDDDPMELQAISFPEGDLEAQAIAFIEEFLSMGMPGDGVMELFRNPFYLGTHRLLVKLGNERIQKLIENQRLSAFIRG